jgi:hypothetical protein
LHHFLGEAAVAQDPLRQGQHGAGMASVGLGERLLVPSRDGDHERGITDLGPVLTPHRSLFGAARGVG